MGEQNGQISDFQGLVTLTLDRVILRTIMHHSSTSTCIPNFIKINKTYCRRTDRQTYKQADGHLRPTLLGRLGGINLKILKVGKWRDKGELLRAHMEWDIVVTRSAQIDGQTNRQPQNTMPLPTLSVGEGLKTILVIVRSNKQQQRNQYRHIPQRRWWQVTPKSLQWVAKHSSLVSLTYIHHTILSLLSPISTTGGALDLRSTSRGFKSYSGWKLRNNLVDLKITRWPYPFFIRYCWSH